MVLDGSLFREDGKRHLSPTFLGSSNPSAIVRERRNAEDKKYRTPADKGNIGVDLDNSPAMPFLAPILDELQKRGSSVPLTARDCFQVHKLGRTMKAAGR